METAIKNMFKRNRIQIIYSIIFTFIWGLVTHGYMFLNNSISHDSLIEFYFTEDVIGHRFGLGRIFVPLYRTVVRGMVTLPWLGGLVSLLFISISVFLITKIFNINSKLNIALVSGIFTANITVISLIETYMHDLECDILAMLMAVIAVYLWNRYKFGFLFGILPLSLAIGLYQSYISTAITLVMIVCIVCLLQGESAKKVFTIGIKAVAMIIGAGIMYFIFLRIEVAITGIELYSGGYNSVTTFFTMSFKEIVAFTVSTYKDTVLMLINPISVYSNEKINLAMHGIIMGVCILAVFPQLFNKKIGILEKIMVVVLAFLLPIGMNISRILDAGISHDLMHFALWLIYLLALIIVIDCAKRSNIKNFAIKMAPRAIVSLVIFAVLWGNVRLANMAYTAKDFEQDANLSFFTRVVSEIEEREDYITGETPVAFIGKPNHLLADIPQYEKLRRFTGGWYYVPGASTPQYYGAYFKYVLMNPAVFASSAEIDELKETSEVKNMPIYPANDSVKMINGILVVKLGNY